MIASTRKQYMPAANLLAAFRALRAGDTDVDPAGVRTLASFTEADRQPYIDTITEVSPVVVDVLVGLGRQGAAMWGGSKKIPPRFLVLINFATDAEMEAAKSLAQSLAAMEHEHAAVIPDPARRSEALTRLFERLYPEDCRWWDAS